MGMLRDNDDQAILPQTRCVRENLASHLGRRGLGQTHEPCEIYSHHQHQTVSSRVVGNYASMAGIVVVSSSMETAGPSDDLDSDARQRQQKKKKRLWNPSSFAFQRASVAQGAHLRSLSTARGNRRGMLCHRSVSVQPSLHWYWTLAMCTL